MLALLIASLHISSTEVAAVAAVGSVLVVVYANVSDGAKERRKEKSVIAGKDKTALEEVASGVKRLEGAVFDRPPSLAEPDGHAGIQTQVIAHGRILSKLMPNGGDTDNPGDLILKIARDRGLTEDTP